MKEEKEDYKPAVKDEVEVYKRPSGSHLPLSHRPIGKIEKKKFFNGIDFWKVVYPAPWGGTTSGWYQSHQLRPTL